MFKGKSVGAWVCLIAAIVLGTIGLFCPPIGKIDNSVLLYCGILFGFGTLFQIPVIIKDVETAKITKGDMSVEISK